jgi:hypothetical protein
MLRLRREVMVFLVFILRCAPFIFVAPAHSPAKPLFVSCHPPAPLNRVRSVSLAFHEMNRERPGALAFYDPYDVLCIARVQCFCTCECVLVGRVHFSAARAPARQPPHQAAPPPPPLPCTVYAPGRWTFMTLRLCPAFPVQNFY